MNKFSSTRLLLVEQWNTVISASVDTSVRVWTLEGNVIGTFGQEKPWTLGVSTTYEHPLKSRDLLLATEAVVTPPLPSSDRSGAESGGDEKSSGKKSQSRKLRAAVHAVQTVLTVTEMEDEVL
jgi:hypothetical protein